jgi:signal transduction protein with GAF and PtsI domain
MKENFWKSMLEATVDSKSSKEFADSMICIIVRYLGGDGGFVYLLDPRKNLIRLFASKNPYPDLTDRLSFSVHEGLTGWIVRTGETLAIERACYRDDRFKLVDKLVEENYEAFIGAPLKAGNEILGAFSVMKKDPGRWKKSETILMEKTGIIAGRIISNFKEADENRRKLQMLDSLSQISSTIISGKYLQEILNLIVSITAEATGSKICSIMLLDEKTGELKIKASQSLSPEYLNKPNLKVGESASGRAVLEKRPIAVPDVTRDPLYRFPDIARKEGLVSLLAVPMIIKGRVVGVINSYTDYPHEFSDEEINLLLSVAAQSAIAIENTKLMEEKIAIQEALESRKIVEKAKGILMKIRNIPEDEAYRILQKQAMDRRKSIKEIAEAIVLAAEIK